MKSFAGNHTAEGLVVRTVTEHWDYKVGRHQFKMKTPAYMEKK